MGIRGQRRARALIRGEIRYVDFEPVTGAEASKRRPAVIVSNDGANSRAAQLGRGVVTVVPISSNIDNVFPFQVLLPASETGLPRDSKAQAEQVRSVDIARVGSTTGTLDAILIAELDEALRLHLAL